MFYIKESIKYKDAERLDNFFTKIPKKCPNCDKYWKPEGPPLRIIKESIFRNIRMSKLYIKKCEFCNYEYNYYG